MSCFKVAVGQERRAAGDVGPHGHKSRLDHQQLVRLDEGI